MKLKHLFVVLLWSMHLPMMAQLTFDGKRPVYDKLTKTYLLTLPDTTFGRPYQAVAVFDDTVSWVALGGKMIRQGIA